MNEPTTIPIELPPETFCSDPEVPILTGSEVKAHYVILVILVTLTVVQFWPNLWENFSSTFDGINVDCIEKKPYPL
jgi:hypothetical protein